MNDRHRLSMNFLKLFDILLVAVAFGLSTAFMVSAQQSASLAQFLAIRTRVSDFMMFGLALFLCYIVLCSCGLYRPITLSVEARKSATCCAQRHSALSVSSSSAGSFPYT